MFTSEYINQPIFSHFSIHAGTDPSRERKKKGVSFSTILPIDWSGVKVRTCIQNSHAPKTQRKVFKFFVHGVGRSIKCKGCVWGLCGYGDRQLCFYMFYECMANPWQGSKTLLLTNFSTNWGATRVKIYTQMRMNPLTISIWFGRRARILNVFQLPGAGSASYCTTYY